MGFGDTLLSAYQQATDVQRAAAARVASGVDWVGKQSDAAATKVKAVANQAADAANAGADWVSQKTTEAIRKANAEASRLAAVAEKQARELANQTRAAADQLADAAKKKAKDTAQAVRQVYRKAEKKVTDAVADGVTTTCDYAEKMRAAARKKLDEGMQNAAARARNGKPPELEKKEKAGAEADRRNYRSFGDEEPPKPWEPKFEVKGQVYSGQRSALLYGDDDTNIQVGMRKAAVAVGYEHDFNDNRDILGLYIEGQVAGIAGQAKGTLANNLLEGNVQGEVLSAKGSAMAGYMRSSDFNGIKAEAGAELNLVKGGASGQVNITPKTIYDNTLGRAVGLVRPDLRHLSEDYDHGIFFGAEVEGGVGLAAKGTFKANAQDMSIKMGGLIGAGPMAGVYAIFGIK